MTKVSVIIPAYNQGHYLGEAIESVLSQTYQDFEIIVVDDGSADNTSEVAQGFADPRIKYVYQENAGLSAARNTGIRYASGAYLTYLDSDDCFLPRKLELLLQAFTADPDLGFVAGQAILIDEHGEPLHRVFDTPLPEDSAQLLLGNPLHVGAVMVRRSWQERVGFFDVSLRSYEDWDMWLRLAWAGCAMGWVPEPVSLYRFHTAQMTRNGDQMTAATFAVLDKLYRQPDLPEQWLALHDHAYSNAYLRGAAQAYQAADFETAKACLDSAIELRPELLADDASPLAAQFAAWACLPKASDPLGYLETTYDNLPQSLQALARRKDRELGRAAMELAFESYQQGDLETARSASLSAFKHRPGWIRNRGAVSILIRSVLHGTARATNE